MALSTVAALLTTVASLLVGHSTPVYCTHPPGVPWTGRVAGWTYYSPSPHLYLRYCRETVRLQGWAGEVFAHELIHVEHPNWQHPKVYALEGWYWTHVVRRKLYLAEH